MEKQFDVGVLQKCTKILETKFERECQNFLCSWIGGYKAIAENVVVRNIKVGLRAHNTSIKQKMY